MDEPEPKSGETENTKVGTVADGILDQFFDALAAKEGFGLISERLRAAIKAKGVTNEVAIRAAIFDEPTP